MIDITDANAESVLAEATKPVVVDFYTNWCGPCRAAAPKYKEWSEKYRDKAVFAKCDAEEAPDFAGKNNISGVPTFIVFRDCKEAKRFVGVPKESDLVEAIS